MKSETVQEKKDKSKSIFKAIGSVLFAIIASSHHWLHTLLIALGLSTLSTGLFSLSPSIKFAFLILSVIFSLGFILLAKRKWSYDRPSAWAYLISSLISIVLVVTALPQTFKALNQQPQQQQEDIHHK